LVLAVFTLMVIFQRQSDRSRRNEDSACDTQ
jgi:hypothetical protein